MPPGPQASRRSELATQDIVLNWTVMAMAKPVNPIAGTETQVTTAATREPGRHGLGKTIACSLRRAAIALLFVSVPAAADTIAGVAKAIDGDSMTVGDVEVRLYGIDAPESVQSCSVAGRAWACGSEARDQLSKLVEGRQVACSIVGGDTFGRTLARCMVGQVDVNRTMVATGYAVAYRRYSIDYVSAEESAKVNKRGIWAGTFEMPSDFRHAGDDYVVAGPDRPNRARSAVSSPRHPAPPNSATGCRIKGNHSRRGELIYHMPGMPYYEETNAEEMFCSEADARAAGHRRSRADQHR